VSGSEEPALRPWPVSNPWSGAPVLYRERTRSTMEDAMRLHELGYPHGTVVVAGYQELGRGRLPGRRWESEPGANLLFTLLLTRPFPGPPLRLPVLAGLALSLALEERFGLSTEVKWPNDVLHRRRKLAGVLCEARSLSEERPVLLVGIGVNANQRGFAAGLAGQVCSLAQLLDREVELPGLLEHVLKAFFAVLQNSSWRGRLEQRLCGLGQEVTVVQAPEGGLTGVLRGVAEDGALLLEQDGQLRPVYGGELRLLLQPDAQAEAFGAP
jgi:BirA family biotin operon repressor/biotin-[acetyl-CoA-carboxylase] ligase